MNNEEAMALLIAKRAWINADINNLKLYIQEVYAKPPRWTDDAVKARERDKIKALAAKVGVDLSAWDGQPAPEEVNSGE